MAVRATQLRGREEAIAVDDDRAFQQRERETARLGVPVEKPTDPELTPPRGWAAAAVFAVAFAAFFAIGYFFVVNPHVIVFDGLDRLTRAFLVWHNEPEKLAAIGFSFPPMTTLVFLPLAILKPLATSLLALPLTSAFFAAVTIVFLDRALARCALRPLLRYPLLLAFALNPLFAFYAGNGMGEAVYMAGLALTLYALVGWFTTRQPRFLVAAGIALAMIILTRYSFVYWAVAIAIAIVAAIASRRHAKSEDEGALVTLLAPSVYGLTLWVFFNTLIADDMFGWLDAGTGLAVNAPAGEVSPDISITDAIGRCLEVTAGVFPLAFVVFAGLLFAFFSTRSQLALWLALLIPLGLGINAAEAYLSQEANALALRNFLPVLLVAAVGAGWLFRALEAWRIVVYAVTLVVTVVSIPLALETMRGYPYQNLEQAFVRAVTSGGEDQEGTTSTGGFRVGIDPERQMAAYIEENVDADNSVLTDNAHTFGVILLSGQPELFFDRIDRGDGVFRTVLDDPFGKVDYMLVATQAENDLVGATLEGDEGIDQPGLTTVFETERYRLVEVDRTEPETVPTPASFSPAQEPDPAGRVRVAIVR